MRIRTKLFVSMIPLAIIPIIIFGFFTLSQIKKDRLDSTILRIKNITGQAADNLDWEIKQLQANLDVFSKSERV